MGLKETGRAPPSPHCAVDWSLTCWGPSALQLWTNEGESRMLLQGLCVCVWGGAVQTQCADRSLLGKSMNMLQNPPTPPHPLLLCATTITHTLPLCLTLLTHTFDRRTRRLLAHAHSGRSQHRHVHAPPQLHCLISVRGLSTASTAEAGGSAPEEDGRIPRRHGLIGSPEEAEEPGSSSRAHALARRVGASGSLPWGEGQSPPGAGACFSRPELVLTVC